ncbi:hypothetical protein BT69DRAFT_1322792 [Atractiella rhizophila]|nr:hypothetical protein BT69DRAFT_1322792 [Atractiella rhizophila]
MHQGKAPSNQQPSRSDSLPPLSPSGYGSPPLWWKRRPMVHESSYTPEPETPVFQFNVPPAGDSRPLFASQPSRQPPLPERSVPGQPPARQQPHPQPIREQPNRSQQLPQAKDPLLPQSYQPHPPPQTQQEPSRAKEPPSQQLGQTTDPGPQTQVPLSRLHWARRNVAGASSEHANKQPETQHSASQIQTLVPAESPPPNVSFASAPPPGGKSSFVPVDPGQANQELGPSAGRSNEASTQPRKNTIPPFKRMVEEDSAEEEEEESDGENKGNSLAQPASSRLHWANRNIGGGSNTSAQQTSSQQQPSIVGQPFIRSVQAPSEPTKLENKPRTMANPAVSIADADSKAKAAKTSTASQSLFGPFASTAQPTSTSNHGASTSAQAARVAQRNVPLTTPSAPRASSVRETAEKNQGDREIQFEHLVPQKSGRERKLRDQMLAREMEAAAQEEEKYLKPLREQQVARDEMIANSLAQEEAVNWEREREIMDFQLARQLEEQEKEAARRWAEQDHQLASQLEQEEREILRRRAEGDEQLAEELQPRRGRRPNREEEATRIEEQQTRGDERNEGDDIDRPDREDADLGPSFNRPPSGNLVRSICCVITSEKAPTPNRQTPRETELLFMMDRGGLPLPEDFMTLKGY